MEPISSPKYSQCVSGVGEDARVVLARLKRPPSEIHTLAAGCLPALQPSRPA